jgi:hypothetical protein
MNRTVKGTAVLTKQDVEDADHVCDHVQIGSPTIYVGEQDNFGPVSRHWYCKNCYQEYLAQEAIAQADERMDVEST